METYDTTTTRLHAEDLGLCALAQDLLPLYLEGEVSPGSRELITQHLAHCERCRGFLAGAQSVHSQLRREAIQRRGVAEAVAPEQRILWRWQQLLAAGVIFLICVVGGAASLLLAGGLRYSSGISSLIAGLVIGMGALMALLLLARGLGPLSPDRIGQLLGGVGLGLGAAFLIIGSGGPALLLGVLLAMVAVVVVEWAALATPRPARSANM